MQSFSMDKTGKNVFQSNLEKKKNLRHLFRGVFNHKKILQLPKTSLARHPFLGKYISTAKFWLQKGRHSLNATAVASANKHSHYQTGNHDMRPMTPKVT